MDKLKRGRNIKRTNRQTDEVDYLVGATLKKYRKQAGKTQQDLGDALGLSFKQIRKYEAAENRISASSLFILTQLLEVSIEDFFREISPQLIQRNEALAVKSAELLNDVNDHSLTKETSQLVKLYYTIDCRKKRQVLLDLVRSISEASNIQNISYLSK
ncbi:MAG: helix-turn-helix transcriptional regulator [Alphaproteobacteria bacterium]|nr:helix-turn-helix transcriptional regulator [Alphaproteobacteria bacterium]